MKTLDEIGIANGTDKASKFSRTYAKPHDYLRHMELFLEPLREKEIVLTEIGVGGGESIRTWLEYFPNARVVGIDIVSKTNEWNTPKGFDGLRPLQNESHRYAFHAADQTDETFWRCFAADYGQSFDIAVDDGVHEPKAVQLTFAHLWPLIKPGGFYVTEDLGCGFTNPGCPSHPDWIASLTAPMVAAGLMDIDSIYVAKELCIIRKKS